MTQNNINEANNYLKLQIPYYDISQSAIETIKSVYSLEELLNMIPKYIRDKEDGSRSTFNLGKNMNGDYKGGYWNIVGVGVDKDPYSIVIRALIYLNTLGNNYEAIY